MPLEIYQCDSDPCCLLYLVFDEQFILDNYQINLANLAIKSHNFCLLMYDKHGRCYFVIQTFGY